MVGGIALFTLAPLFNPDIKTNMDDYQFVCSLVSEDQVLFVAPDKTGIKDWEGLQEYAKNRSGNIWRKYPRRRYSLNPDHAVWRSRD